MQKIFYLIIINIGGIEFGMRHNQSKFYLDLLVERNGKTIAINKHSKLKEEFDKELLNLKVDTNIELIFNQILTEFLLGVK